MGHFNSRCVRLAGCILALIGISPGSASVAEAAELYDRNIEVPFAYQSDGERTWQITDAHLAADEDLAFEWLDGAVADDLNVSLQRDGRLRVVSSGEAEGGSRSLKVTLRKGDGVETSQTLQLLPAPPDRPISYLSDLVDDLLRIFWDSDEGRWLPVTQDAFDQYFRRMQAHGVRRLIVWQSSFPLICDPANYRAGDWARFSGQARAILENAELNDILYGSKRRGAYQWQGFMMRFRLNPEWGQMFAQSAADHGIKLSASYRPFEQALMKYYVVPAFDHDGSFLWNFLPAANPTVNYRPDEVAFAHYRKILRELNRHSEADVTKVTFAAVPGASKQDPVSGSLRIFASDVPPLAGDSFVLVRDQQGQFGLHRYQSIADQAHSRRTELEGWSLSINDQGAIEVSDLKMPVDARYLIFTCGADERGTLQLPVDLALDVRSEAGNRLGRFNAYWALDESDAEAATTRVAGITRVGGYRTDFKAIENSVRLVAKSGQLLRPIGRDEIVVDFGSAWSPEMMDYQRAAAREVAVNEIRTMLEAPAFDEIFINTRSHTQLAGSHGDGEFGVQTQAHYRRQGKNYHHLGIDRAYAPLAVGQADSVSELLESKPAGRLEKLTTWQSGEWQGSRQLGSAGYPWRYARNVAVADGIRQLLQELEREFPATRIRAVIPPRAAVEDVVPEKLKKLPNPEGGFYGVNTYGYLRSGINHIPAIGEGMTLVDLTGLRTQPVLLGFRNLPDEGPARLQLDAYLSDQADNHGSSFRGPKSFFYEAQESLRAEDKSAATMRRKQIIHDVLEREEISEVILYESADWTYYLPMEDPHAFVEKR